jgi:death-on-curing protein
MEPVRFLTIVHNLVIHQKIIERYGGDPTIRDLGLIESAVMMPQQTFDGAYLHSTVASMASAYLFHLCSNHGFADGNKRTALGATLVFLDVNGYDLSLTNVELEQITLDVAAANMDKESQKKLFETAVRPRK